MRDPFWPTLTVVEQHHLDQANRRACHGYSVLPHAGRPKKLPPIPVGAMTLWSRGVSQDRKSYWQRQVYLGLV